MFITFRKPQRIFFREHLFSQIRLKTFISYMLVLANQPILSQCTLSLPPKTIKKPYRFLMFLGGKESVHWEKMG